jgi:6-phosphofructokinase 1
MSRGKESSIIIVAEGPVSGRSYEIQHILKDLYKLDAHVAILGHIQRGGSPTSNDRFIASEMGSLAVTALIEGNTPSVTVVRDGKVLMAPLAECITKADHNFIQYQKLAETLSI